MKASRLVRATVAALVAAGAFAAAADANTCVWFPNQHVPVGGTITPAHWWYINYAYSVNINANGGQNRAVINIYDCGGLRYSYNVPGTAQWPPGGPAGQNYPLLVQALNPTAYAQDMDLGAWSMNACVQFGGC